MLLSCQTLDLLYAFYIFFGTNLLTQCQVPAPVFFPCFRPFSEEYFKRSPNGIKLPKRFFPKQKTIGRLENQGRGPPRTPQALMARQGGPAPPRLVGSLGLLCPRSFAYIFPKIPEKIKRATKILFRRRKLVSLQDPNWGTFWCPAGGGIRIRRASSSTP